MSDDFGSNPVNSSGDGLAGIKSSVAVGVEAHKNESAYGDSVYLVENRESSGSAIQGDPHDLSNPGKPTTNLQTLMNLIKGNVGIGILAMPSALVNAGLATGTAAILALGFLATYCMKQLVDVSVHLAEKNPDILHLNYPDTCYEAVKANSRFTRLARPFRMMVNVFIVATQIMGCTAYLLFISSTMSQLVELFTGFKMAIQLWELIVLGALIPYVQVRQLRILSFFTTVANGCVLVSLIIITQYVVRDRTIAVENMNIWGNISTYPLAFGTVIFAFEGINLVMPLRNKMKEPTDFDGWNGVLVLGMTIITALYAFIGLFGFLKIGDQFNDVITDYIIPLIKTDAIGWLYLTCIILVVLQIFISYGLQLYVSVIILFPPLAKVIPVSPFWGETIIRCLLAAFTYALAASVPCLSEIFSLVGAFTGSSLSILIPAIIDMITFIPVHHQNGHKGKLVFLLVKNGLILVVGFAGFFIGTYTSVAQIADKLEHGGCLS